MMNGMISKITDSEIEIMRILWRSEQPLPLAEIRKQLELTSSWDVSTIKTLTRRLCEKGVVEAFKNGVFCYKALVTEAEYNEFATQSLIDRLYSGSAKNLVASLLGHKKLNQQEVAELREMFKVGESDD